MRLSIMVKIKKKILLVQKKIGENSAQAEDKNIKQYIFTTLIMEERRERRSLSSILIASSVPNL